MALRVAVLGASGFGRHHAKWYAQLGCEVVAFLGSSPRSVAATGAALEQAFGFRGRGYTSLAELLAAERPDAVSVCTPPPLHGEHVLAALEAGSSVLCEKPFVWNPDASGGVLAAEARRLVELAEQKGLVLSVNTQYVAAAEPYRHLAPAAVAAPSRFYGQMTSKSRPNGRQGRDLCLDLMPHPISFLLALLPDAELRLGSVRARVEDEATKAHFEVETSGRVCSATLEVAHLHEGPFPRRFGFGDSIADVTVAPDAEGVYRGCVRVGDAERVCDDFMKTSVERFCGAVRGEGAPLVGARAALRGIELLLAMLEQAGAAAGGTG